MPKSKQQPKPDDLAPFRKAVAKAERKLKEAKAELARATKGGK